MMRCKRYCYLEKRQRTGWRGEGHWDAGGDVGKKKKINMSTNARTFTAVVRAHRGADRKAGPRRPSSSTVLSAH